MKSKEEIEKSIQNLLGGIWEESVTTLVRVNGKPMKLVKTETLPRGRKVFQHNNNPIPVEPVPVVVVEER